MPRRIILLTWDCQGAYKDGMDRKIIPSAIEAGRAEVLSDPPSPGSLPWRRPRKTKWVSADWMRREIDEITAILKASNDEAERDR